MRKTDDQGTLIGTINVGDGTDRRDAGPNQRAEIVLRGCGVNAEWRYRGEWHVDTFAGACPIDLAIKRTVEAYSDPIWDLQLVDLNE